MRARSLGRWVGHVVAVAAVGVGATLGVATVIADPDRVGVNIEATSEPADLGATTESSEWN